MTHRHTLSTMSLALLASFTTLPASAQDSYYYGGIKAGEAHGKFDVDRISSSLLGSTPRATTLGRDDKDTTYGAFMGYQMNRYLGVEAGFFSLGRFGYNASTVPAGSLDGQIRIQGGSLDLVGTMPLTDRLSVIGRIGGTYARSRATFTGTGAASGVQSNTSDREVNGKYGAGLQYEFSPAFMVRGEAERLRLSDAAGSHGNVNLYTVSLVFPFGRSAAPAPRAMAAPAYVAQAPAPAPAPMPMAAPPAPMPMPMAAPTPAPAPEVMRRRVSFSAETLFGFDKSAMRDDGMSALNAFTQELQGTQFDQIVVEGHTDRLGTATYNQTLSNERAATVKSYLVNTGKLDPVKISTVGKSETMPVTKPEDCQGQQANAKLIACLQPDRRVEVEVTGTR